MSVLRNTSSSDECRSEKEEDDKEQIPDVQGDIIEMSSSRRRPGGPKLFKLLNATKIL